MGTGNWAKGKQGFQETSRSGPARSAGLSAGSAVGTSTIVVPEVGGFNSPERVAVREALIEKRRAETRPRARELTERLKHDLVVQNLAATLHAKWAGQDGAIQFIGQSDFGRHSGSRHYVMARVLRDGNADTESSESSVAGAVFHSVMDGRAQELLKTLDDESCALHIDTATAEISVRSNYDIDYGLNTVDGEPV